ncbi:MAG: hypothetical protein RR572_03635, partial [Raoultibacter sp.]
LVCGARLLFIIFHPQISRFILRLSQQRKGFRSMSGVVKSKQHTTNIKFIEVARQLDVFTLRMTQKLPKRTAFYLNVHLTDLSNNIVRCVQIANSIYISTPQDFEQRRALLLEARGCCQALSSKVA